MFSETILSIIAYIFLLLTGSEGMADDDSFIEQYLDKVEPVDYVILALIQNGVRKYTKIFESFKKIPITKFRDHFNKLERLNLITIDSTESWIKRNTNPSIVLKNDGIKLIKEKSNLQELFKQYVKY